MLHFPSPVTHRTARHGLALLALVGGGLLLHGGPEAAVRSASQPSRNVTISLSREISLQESLDLLGYTVNVPSSAVSWGYRTSTKDDSLSGTPFVASPAASFRKLGQQAYLAGVSSFGWRGNGSETTIFGESGDNSLWLDSSGSSTSAHIEGIGIFTLSHPSASMFGPLATRDLSSSSEENPTHRQQVLVFPARVGGHWVSDGANAGHWAGGAETGDYLLCWDDLPEGQQDFQDMIVLAHGVKPATPVY